TGEFTVEKFENLKTSTITMMVYHNIEFKNYSKAFELIKLTDVEIFYTKKHKKVDKSKIVAPKGAIYSLLLNNYVRGANIRKGELHWCPKCRLRDDKDKKIKTTREVLVDTNHPGIKHMTHFKCYNCSTCFDGRELKKKIHHFLNQMAIGMSLGDRNVHIMMFKSSFKIAGCKSKDDARYITKRLIKELIKLNKEAIKYTTKNKYKIKEYEEINKLKSSETYDEKDEIKIQKLQKSVLPIFNYKDPNKEMRFQYDCTMLNKGFWLNIFLDQEVLNTVMNDEKYSDHVIMSIYETT
ncbi:unnamed protein product, partial [marine sediment metagenome]